MTGEKPSRESMREVKREYRERRKAQRQRPPLRLVKPPKPRRTSNGVGPGKALVVVGLLVGTVGVAAAVVGDPPSPPSSRASNDRVPVLVPTQSPEPARTVPPPGDPFRGSKVSHWPVGAAGFVAPKAAPVGTFNAAQVKAAYDATLRYLKAAMVDERVLYKGDLAPVRAALDPRTWRNADPVDLANRFRRDVVPASAEIRVNGVLSARPGKHQRLDVEFRYVAVYALRLAKGGATELVTVRRAGTMTFEKAGRGISPAWLTLVGHTSSHSRCGWKWPDAKTYTEVWLEPVQSREAPAPTASASGPREQINLLDPLAKEPTGCFDNTGEP